MTTKIWTSSDADNWERMLYSQLDSLEWPSKQFQHWTEGITMNRITLGTLKPAVRPKAKDIQKGAPR